MEEEGFNINSTRWSGWALLHRAAELGNIEICKILLDAGADINIRSTWGWHTPLHLALGNGWLECALFLWEHGANVKIQNKSKYVPIAYGLQRGYGGASREFSAEVLRQEIARGVYSESTKKTSSSHLVTEKPMTEVEIE
jgi:ankyrin repeat protein